MKNILTNALSSPKSTLFGILKGALQAGIVAAATQYQSTGDMTNWQPYAFAGVAAAVPIILGMKDVDVTDTPTPDPIADPILQAIDASLQKAREEAVSKAVQALTL